MTVAALTAEWNCTRCGTTNRKLVPLTDERTTDRCTHCRHPAHHRAGYRRVRWAATGRR